MRMLTVSSHSLHYVFNVQEPLLLHTLPHITTSHYPVSNISSYQPTIMCVTVVVTPPTAHLNASDPVTVFDNVSSVELSCDMAGYVPPVSDLQWFRDGVMIQNSSNYTVLYRDGSRHSLRPVSGQSPSVLSVLIITEPAVEDSGECQCRIVSLGLTESVQLMVSLSPTSGKCLFSVDQTYSVLMFAVSNFTCSCPHHGVDMLLARQAIEFHLSLSTTHSLEVVDSVSTGSVCMPRFP